MTSEQPNGEQNSSNLVQHAALAAPVPHNMAAENPLNPQVLAPTAREILKGFKEADNPLDFIRANYVQREAPINPSEIITEVESKRGVEPQQVVSEETQSTVTVDNSSLNTELDKILETKEVSNSPTVEAESLDTVAKENSETAPEEEVLEEVEGEELDSKQINFKAMRKKLSETSKTLEEIAKQKQELEEKLKKVESGEELPEVVRAKDLKIAELEKYQQLHALKLSPAYKEAYVKPIENIKQRLIEIAADYEIPADVLTEALNVTNRRDLNAFLSDHFDDIGALEVKNLIVQAQEITEQAKAAEQEPAKVLERIEEEYKNAEKIKLSQSRQVIKERAKEAWIDSLLQIRKEGKLQELIPRESDTDYNKRVVDPIITAAASEYGKLVRMLAESGLEDLPKELAFALARTVHLAHASAVSVESRVRAEAEARELKENAARTTRYLRPPVGASQAMGGGSGAPNKAPSSPAEAADMILNSVLSRSR